MINTHSLKAVPRHEQPRPPMNLKQFGFLILKLLLAVVAFGVVMIVLVIMLAALIFG